MKIIKNWDFFKTAEVLAVLVLGMCFLVGCSRSIDGTIYLTGVSRLKMEVNGEGKIKSVSSLNKSGSVLLGGDSWKGEAEDTALDTLIPLLQGEDTEIVYVDVFSGSKSWENSEAERLAERYGNGGEEKVPVEVRKIKDFDALEAVWKAEEGSDGDTESPEQEDFGGEEAALRTQSVEDGEEESTDKGEESDVESSAEEEEDASKAREEAETEAESSAEETERAKTAAGTRSPRKSTARPAAAGTTGERSSAQTAAPGTTGEQSSAQSAAPGTTGERPSAAQPSAAGSTEAQPAVAQTAAAGQTDAHPTPSHTPEAGQAGPGQTEAGPAENESVTADPAASQSASPQAGQEYTQEDGPKVTVPETAPPDSTEAEETRQRDWSNWTGEEIPYGPGYENEDTQAAPTVIIVPEGAVAPENERAGGN